MSEEIKLKSEHMKPSNCNECSNFGISEKTVFPSLCKENYLWFQCGGKFGYKLENPNKITVGDLVKKVGLISVPDKKEVE